MLSTFYRFKTNGLVEHSYGYFMMK